MKRNIFTELKNDIWVLVMDVIAVNAAYLFALLIRYYLRFKFAQTALEYLAIYAKFAPFYTVICVVVFWLFHLYSGMWRFASLSDMNRIIAANVVTAILYVVGTRVFFQRLPILYYLIGASTQFMLIAIIRFAYRFFSGERQKLISRRMPARNVMVVGADVAANEVIKYLENDASFRPVVVVDGKSRGKSLRGLPVVENAENAIERYEIKCVIIADPVLPDRTRETLRQMCESKDIELHDYTGFLKNQSGNLPLTDLIKVINGQVKLRADGVEYASIEEAMGKLNGRYSVVSILGDNLTIEIQPEESKMPTEGWVKEYKEETGEDVSFF